MSERLIETILEPAPLGDDLFSVPVLQLRGANFPQPLASLLEDIPDDVFPEEENGAVLIEMIVGSCRPVVDAVGEPECRAATTLLGEVRNKIVDDLRIAAALARPGR